MMTFDNPVNEQARALIKQVFGKKLVANDDKTFLLTEVEFAAADMKKIAKVAKQPARLELSGEGEIKTLADGTRYQVTARGWQKLSSWERDFLDSVAERSSLSERQEEILAKIEEKVFGE